MLATTVLRIAVSSLALLAFAPAAPAQGMPGPVPPRAGPARVIVVDGEGAVEATPDQATIALGVRTIRPTAQDAQAQSSAAMDQIVRQIQALGVPREQIHTATVSLVPQRKPGADDGQITGYEAVNRVTVTVNDLRLTGRLVDAAVGAGANTVDSLAFGLRDPSPYQTRALRIAVQNARATASAIAAAAGIGAIHLVRVEEMGPTVYPRLAVAAPAAGIPVLPGTVPVTARVRVVYAF